MHFTVHLVSQLVYFYSFRLSKEYKGGKSYLSRSACFPTSAFTALLIVVEGMTGKSDDTGRRVRQRKILIVGGRISF